MRPLQISRFSAASPPKFCDRMSVQFATQLYEDNHQEAHKQFLERPTESQKTPPASTYRSRSPKMPPNPFLLAADNPSALLPLLRENPGLASQQDEHGYSLIHAAASYNHLDLLRALVIEFRVPVDLRDEDSETALFVVETVEAARVLVEELDLDIGIAGDDGQTARQKIELDGDFPEVATYLASKEVLNAPNGASNGANGVNGANGTSGATPDEIPPPPEGLSVNFGTMSEAEAAGLPLDPELRRRIEELAARDDFHTEAGQAALQRLVEEALAGEDLTAERNVRPRQG